MDVPGGHWIAGLSLVEGPLPWLLLTGLVAGLALLLVGRRDGRWFRRSVPIALAVTIVVLIAAQVALVVLKPWPDALPLSVPFWVGLGVLAISLAVIGWRRQRWLWRGVAVLAVLLVVVGSANQVNRVYGSFATVDAALQLAPYDQGEAVDLSPDVGPPGPVVPATGQTLAQVWRPPADLPAHGEVTQVDIPGATSGFDARPAWVYLPPAYLTQRPPLLPVWVLLSGQPGSPRDWLDGGALAQQMDAFAAAHGGLAPVVVMPDALGSETGNSLCLDSRLGKAATYLSVDVPNWITSQLTVDTDHAHWLVGGLSFGGTCALQMAVSHPDVYAQLLDASGQQEPTLGTRQLTVQRAFGGDDAAFTAVNPLDQLRTEQLPGSSAFIAVGTQDPVYQPQAATVRDALTAAGARVTYQEFPGGHSWAVWGAALGAALPWSAALTGLAS